VRVDNNSDLYRIFQSVPAMIGVTHGPDHVYQFANPLFLKVIGKTDDIIGKTVMEVFPELESQGAIEILDNVYRTGEVFTSKEYEVLLDTNNDGVLETLYFNFVNQPMRDAEGVIYGVMAHAVEVSEQVNARKKAEDSEAKYRSLFNTMDEGFCVLEMVYDAEDQPVDYIFIETNKIFENQTGLKDVVGKSIKTMVPSFEDVWVKRYGKVAKTGRPIRLSDGSAALGRWFDVHASRVGPAGSKRVAVLFNDTTRQKTAELQQQAAIDQYTSVLESMGDAFFVLDKDWNIQMVNKKQEKIGKIKRADSIGRNFWKVFPTTDNKDSKYWIEYNRAMKTRKPTHFLEYYAPLELWTETDVYPTKEGGISVFFRDVTANRKAAEHIKQSEERFRTLIEKSTDAIQLVDPEGNILFSSESLRNVVGYDPEELQGSGIAPYLHPDDAEYFYAKFCHLIKYPKQPINMEYRIKHKDGSWAWLETTGVNHLKTPNIQALVGTFRNITERKAAEEQTNYQKSLLESQQEVSPLGIIIVSETGQIVSFNKRFATMWRMPEGVLESERDEAALRAAQEQLVDPETFIDRVTEMYEQQKSNNELLYFNDGRIFERFGSPIFGEHKKYLGYVWYFLDITEEKRAEEALKSSEERLRFMAESMPQMVFTADAAGKADYYNPQWTEYTGMSIDNIMDGGWQTLVHPRDQDISLAAWNTSIASGEPYEVEQRYRGKDGKYHWHITRAQAMHDKDGKVIKWIGSSTDVDSIRRTLSQKKHLETVNAALKEQRAQLIELNAAKDEFISLASHQLRTPATGVKQYLGMVLDGFAGDLSTDMERLVSRANQSNERQILVINDLLKVAQVDAGKVRLNKQPTTIGKMITEIVAEQADKFKERKQQVEILYPPDDVSVDVDPARMRMVLENLIDNASKYTPHGKNISLRAEQADRAVCIDIQDQGVGIDSDNIDKLFKKFSRLDNPLSVSVGGTGLGLYWAKKIVDLHGGSIGVKSVVGKGTSFTVKLPV